jgi:threonine dehydratase
MNDLEQIESAAKLIARYMPPTPQYCWPLLCERAGTEVWVKHENHTPIGAFKVRGGLVFMEGLKSLRGDVSGVITATRGNHGQSIAYAGRAHGLKSVVVVPHGNSVEKNRAMRALGAELIEHGEDFNAAHDHAKGLAAHEGLYMVPSFDPLLVRGVATYSLEFLRGAGDLDVVYVPIGLGSGICGMIAARDALGRRTEVVGVVSERAAAYALSFEAGRPIATNSADTMADGVAVRIPDPTAFEIIRRGAARVVQVSEDEIKAAMRAYYTDTHNLAEGAGAAPLAALLKEKDRLKGKRAGVVLSGGNVDAPVFRAVLSEN